MTFIEFREHDSRPLFEHLPFEPFPHCLVINVDGNKNSWRRSDETVYHRHQPPRAFDRSPIVIEVRTSDPARKSAKSTTFPTLFGPRRASRSRTPVNGSPS